MSTILVVSDTHGEKEKFKKLVTQCNTDYIFFLGDKISDIDGVEGVISVKGNWDITSLQPTEKIVEVDGVKIMLTHGHNYGVRQGLDKLVKKAKDKDVSLVLYGHTHKTNNTIIDGITLVNPGSFSFFKGGQFTYSIIKIEDKKIYVNMLNYFEIIC